MSKKYSKAWFLETAKFKVNKISILIILFAIFVDVVGCVFASSVSIPFWLDSIGTMTTAIQFGPVAGCMVSLFSAGILVLIGAASPIWLCVNLMVALVVGFMFPGNREEDALGVVSLAIFTGLISAATYLPVNLYYFKGLPQNTWGDSLYYMLSNRVNNPVVNAFLAEAFITVPDRVLSIFIAIFLVNVEKVRILKQKRKKWAKLGSSMTLVVAIVLSLFFQVESVCAGNNVVSYTSDDLFYEENNVK
ncbi:MAG: hypothetical protein K6C35_06485 [Eubacterium sp.]|nr:hypothetical protein [Eubacterium sp.]